MRYHDPEEVLTDFQRMPGTPIKPDNFSCVILEAEREMLHSQAYPFCSTDPTCPCHEDPELIAEVAKQVDDGLLTKEEATRVVKGEQI